MSKTLEEDMVKVKRDRTVIEDEKGNREIKKNWSRLVRLRIWLNRWWVFVLVFLALCTLTQTVISVYKLICPDHQANHF